MAEWQSLLGGLEITDGAVAGLSASDKPVLEGKLLQLPAADRPLFFVDRTRLDVQVVALRKGAVETGHRVLLPLFMRRGDPAILKSNGKAADRLLLINIDSMVLAEKAEVKVLDPEDDRSSWVFPVDDGNGLSEQLFVYEAVLQVSPYKGLHSGDGIEQETLSNCSALLQGTLSNCSAFAQHLKLYVAHGHLD